MLEVKIRYKAFPLFSSHLDVSLHLIQFVEWHSSSHQIRPLWRHYYQNTQVVFLVVDSNDRDRILGTNPYNTTEDLLLRLLPEEELATCIICIMANKQDLPQAMSVAEISDRLQLASRLRGRQWNIFACCATSGDGLYEALDWVVTTYLQHRR